MFKIMRRDPFLPILGMFDEFVKNSTTEGVSAVHESMSAMALDLTETEKEYRIIANLPGITKEDVKISLDNNQLTIEASHQSDVPNEKEIVHHRERFFGKYHRLISLPANADVNQIKAKMENGLLDLTIPKVAEKPQTYISVD